MRGGVAKFRAGDRIRTPAVRSSRRRAGSACAVFAVLLGATGLAACGTSSAATGTVTLNFYLYPDTSGATQAAINNCDKQSNGKYTISWQQLPAAADGQRQQLVRRLAAHDTTIDIMGLDVTWEAEFATAGWIVPWTGANKAAAENGTLKPALDTAIWHGTLYAVPDNSNTQLLWYRSDLVKTPPKTWAQMIADAEQLAKEGKPHFIEIQGAQYEGATVWFNTMVASGGGTHPEPDRDQGDAGRARRQGADHHEAARQSPRPRTRRWACRWRTRTGWPWRRARRPSS